MKTKELSYAQQVILRWYEDDPSVFDTKGNNKWLLLYINRWLGVQQYTEWFIQDRMAKMPYETFRRDVQLLIADGHIKISDENMTARHRAEAETRETILTATVRPKKKRKVYDFPQTQAYTRSDGSIGYRTI